MCVEVYVRKTPVPDEASAEEQSALVIDVHTDLEESKNRKQEDRDDEEGTERRDEGARRCCWRVVNRLHASFGSGSRMSHRIVRVRASPHNSRTTPAVPRIPGVQGAPRAPCAWMLAGYFVRPPLRWQSPAGDLLVPRAPADGRRRRSSSSRRKISRGNKVYLGIPSRRRKRPLFSQRLARVSAGCP